MRTSDWSAIAASSPINADAARAYVYAYGGEEPLLLERAVRDIPAEKSKDPGFRNLIGVKAGYLRVIAYAGTRRQNGARWIVRCLCGRYEFRSSKAIKAILANALGTGKKCRECHHLDLVRKQQKNQSPTP